MINWHFWLATLGIVFYASSMWVAGITQGLMWREYGSDGYLVNSFIDTVAALHPMYILRMVGGLMYLTGALIMVWNIWMTILGKQRDEAPMGDLVYDDTGDHPILPPHQAQPAE
jgi:cytochrome c oxidase cbb3-type subunit 1